jgi:3-methylfumaryl-CoA hydratase
MFAGGRLAFSPGATVGGSLHRRSAVAEVREKEGRSGPLLFVEVAHEIDADATPATIRESQDIVYRQADSSRQSLPAVVAVDDAGWEFLLDLDVTRPLLFRFSALTYNAHRIHYDLPYATEVEGYPELVIHGPLMAIGLAEVVRRHLPDRQMATFEFRGVRPAFATGALHLRGRLVGDDVVDLEAVSPAGEVAMTATATLAPI